MKEEAVQPIIQPIVQPVQHILQPIQDLGDLPQIQEEDLVAAFEDVKLEVEQQVRRVQSYDEII